MKVYIPHEDEHVGGVSTFKHNLIQGLIKNQISVTHDIHEPTDIVFVNTSRYTISGLLLQKRYGAKIVQRLDGAYYPANHGRLYALHNIKMKWAKQYLANHIIYQSQYSEIVCEKFLGRPKTDSTIIYNGVDTDVFSPHGDPAHVRDNPTQKILISVGAFRRAEQIEPLLEATKQVYKSHPNLKLILIGPLGSSYTKSLVSLPFIQHVDTIGHAELPNYLRAADLFLFSDRSACPNVVLEAMATGLPIIAFQKGAIPELIRDRGVGYIIDYPSAEFFQVIHPSDTAGMAKILLESLTDDIRFFSREKIAQYVKIHFSLPMMIEKYIRVFTHILA